ncbi:MAG: hypothetical protein NC177_17055 [Ruminococcus flavefaciens]|nr:hypothetical protein [Eubacterium sp.]MCM1508819.1 hypothetical protein [Ruminococcus flavefaciens]
MKKRLFALLTISMALLMFLGVTVCAVEARYAHTTSVTSNLTISNGTAYCKSSAQGDSTVTQIDGIQYLEKKNGDDWNIVDSWSDSAKGNYLTMSNSKDNIGSGTFRVRTVFTVYSGSSSEVVEKISKEKTV